MLIYIQTIRTKKNEFELIHSHYRGLTSIDEQSFIWSDENNDRLRAAIVNVGFALNELAKYDNDTYNNNIKIVGIESDKDGKDKRDGGEHDILYNLLVPANDFEGRKMRSLYNGYERYLGRCIMLMWKHNVSIVLQDRGLGRVQYA